ncbi:hypothetical protein BGZ65_004745 [Modicella reniformis]|uniref:Uncharacterized protein n=1 Tax=Modicella reniformis TaxID=1440133 RepID=A0A9P6STC3_9FUNG|nr:hypothetical protein BGZ65_004745 [Modicella reniformis]
MPEGAYEPKRVSTRKGANKKQGQAYKNNFAFHANKGSKLTKKIAEMPVGGLCEKCVEVIMWRKKFKKYKPLTTMKKCVSCQQKSIKEAYHVVCNKCAGEKNVCAKCLESREIVPTNIKSEKEIVQEKVKLERLLSSMTERERRSYLRQMERKNKEGGPEDGENDNEEEDSDSDSEDEDDSDEDDDDDDDDDDDGNEAEK